mgnify:CR=1 FL=1
MKIFDVYNAYKDIVDKIAATDTLSTYEKNKYINQIEIEYMLEDLKNTSNPYTCPHGRPIIIKFDKYEIEKWFKRVV